VSRAENELRTDLEQSQPEEDNETEQGEESTLRPEDRRSTRTHKTPAWLSDYVTQVNSKKRAEEPVHVSGVG
jgi:hypothetical protein